MKSNTTTCAGATLTEETLMGPGAPTALSVVFDATADIEHLCDEITEQSAWLDVDGKTAQPCLVIRVLAARIKALNSVVMSYTDGNDITVRQAYKAVYGTRGRNYWDEAVQSTATPKANFMAGCEAVQKQSTEEASVNKTPAMVTA